MSRSWCARAQLLDYTPGGPDYNATAAARDIGAADEIHGESGDDFIYAQVGNDVVFGEGQDDAIVGGYGNDWISAGTGDDAVLGDDGRIFASRNSTAFGEPLYGIARDPGGADQRDHREFERRLPGDHQRRRGAQVHRRPDAVQRGSEQCRADNPDAARALRQ